MHAPRIVSWLLLYAAVYMLFEPLIVPWRPQLAAPGKTEKLQVYHFIIFSLF